MIESKYLRTMRGDNHDLAIINQELHETSLINEDANEEVIPILETDRSAVKVSMIKKNNEIIYQNNILIQGDNDKEETGFGVNAESYMHQRFNQIKRLRGDNVAESLRSHPLAHQTLLMPQQQEQPKYLNVSEFEIPLKKSRQIKTTKPRIPRLLSAKPPMSGTFQNTNFAVATIHTSNLILQAPNLPEQQRTIQVVQSPTSTKIKCLGSFCRGSNFDVGSPFNMATVQMPADLLQKVNLTAKILKEKFFFQIPNRAIRLSTIEKVQIDIQSGIAIKGKQMRSLFQVNSKILKEAYNQVELSLNPNYEQPPDIESKQERRTMQQINQGDISVLQTRSISSHYKQRNATTAKKTWHEHDKKPVSKTTHKPMKCDFSAQAEEDHGPSQSQALLIKMPHQHSHSKLQFESSPPLLESHKMSSAVNHYNHGESPNQRNACLNLNIDIHSNGLNTLNYMSSENLKHDNRIDNRCFKALQIVDNSHQDQKKVGRHRRSESGKSFDIRVGIIGHQMQQQSPMHNASRTKLMNRTIVNGMSSTNRLIKPVESGTTKVCFKCFVVYSNILAIYDDDL
ncbi:hypothetical protein FGO68_gene16180 [Halteria grandinella]|uniref:Uncharacterized protein n=1 Tax=Halteria grandinella TaxID=5974 RepID=A0A8J8T880_HALGN|nr:hypothetical protein FGO68_gene16180 [Halteria grandinella]